MIGHSEAAMELLHELGDGAQHRGAAVYGRTVQP
jgi:hypothetical protein